MKPGSAAPSETGGPARRPRRAGGRTIDPAETAHQNAALRQDAVNQQDAFRTHLDFAHRLRDRQRNGLHADGHRRVRYDRATGTDDR